MKITDLLEGPGEEEDMEDRKEAELVVEVVRRSSAREAVRAVDLVFPRGGGGSAGAATGSGGDAEGGGGDEVEIGDGWFELPDEEEDMEIRKEADLVWEVVEQMMAPEAVREGFLGEGSAGAATGSGCDALTRRGRGCGDTEGGGGAAVTGRSVGDAVVTGRGFDPSAEEEGWDWEDVGVALEDADDDWEMVGSGDVVPGGGEAMRGVGGGGGWLGIVKRTLIAGGARALFWPTLARNFTLNTILPDFHWWDRVDQHIILGAVPLRKHVHELKESGVRAVVTLTESFETLVPSLDYQIRYKKMAREDAWNHTKSKRPRIALTDAQEQTVIQFEKLNRAGGLPLDHAE